MNPRLIAAQIIADVVNGYSLAEILEESIASLSDSRDRALVQAMCFGVCRYYSCLDVILSHLLKKPMNAEDSDVRALLLVGLYQLRYMRVPTHAAVSETVNATEGLQKPWVRGLVNAVLRNYLRQLDTIDEKIKKELTAEYAHPGWWIEAIKKAWPNDWQGILTANNEHPPMALRLNEWQRYIMS